MLGVIFPLVPWRHFGLSERTIVFFFLNLKSTFLVCFKDQTKPYKAVLSTGFMHRRAVPFDLRCCGLLCIAVLSPLLARLLGLILFVSHMEKPRSRVIGQVSSHRTRGWQGFFFFFVCLFGFGFLYFFKQQDTGVILLSSI